MGTPSCCISAPSWMDTSNVIDLIGIIINAILAYWIVYTLQNRLTNKRVLKDHFIDEVKVIRDDYRNCLSNLYSDKTFAKNIIPWFKLMSIKIDDLMSVINTKYNIDKDKLFAYQNTLREIITENEDFIRQFESGNAIKFSERSKNLFIKFQQEHNHLFNEIIIEINDWE